MTQDLQKQTPPAPPRPDISLGEIGRALWRRKVVFLLIFFAALGLAALASHRLSKRWRAEAQMALIERATNTSNGPQAAYAAPVIETVESQIAMLQSAAMPKRVAAWLNAHPSRPGVPESWSPATLPLAVTVANPKDTDVIEVTSDADNPDRAARFADAFCLAFLQWKKELAQQQVQGIAQSLQVRSARAQAQMLAAAQQEKQFKQQHHLADVSVQEKFLLDQYQLQQAEVSDLEKQRDSLDARLANLKAAVNAKNAQIKNGSGVRDDALVLKLQSQLVQLEADRADAGQKYTAAYPGMLRVLDAKIRDTKAQLNQTVHGILSGKIPSLQAQNALLSDYQQTQVNAVETEAKLTAANRLRVSMQAQIAQLPQLDAQYKQLVRNEDLTNTLYTSLQSSLEAARLDAQIAAGNVQITQSAIVPAKPYRPNLTQNLALGGLVGLFLASLAVMLLEQGDRRVRDTADLERLVPATILGSLPVLPAADAARLLGENTPAAVQEAFRLAYANLRLTLHQSQRIHILHHSLILVASAVPGEGKTTTATHLARTIARSGKRVILVDTDLHVSDPALPGEMPGERPGGELGETEYPLGRLRPVGLADVLRGTVTLEQAITTTADRNLRVLARGRVDSDSVSFVTQPRMDQTLQALRNLAEVVIVDTPACSKHADIFFFAPMADCIIQVIGAGKLDEASLRHTYEALAAARPHLLAMFFNFSPEHQPAFLTRPAGEEAAWQSTEKVILSENRTTKIIVQSTPGKPPTASLARPPYREE